MPRSHDPLGITFHIGRAHSAALIPEIVELLADGRLRPELVTTSVIAWDDAPDRYLEPTVKLVVTRSPTTHLAAGPGRGTA